MTRINKNLIFGFIIGCLYSIIIFPQKEKEPTLINFTFYPIIYNGMIILPINNNISFHLHHWIISLLIIVYLSQIKNYGFIFGFFLFLLFQGLTYNDFNEIIVKNPYIK